MTVATMDRRIINLEKDFFWLNAMRFAIKPATFKLIFLSLTKVRRRKRFLLFLTEFHNIIYQLEVRSRMKKFLLLFLGFGAIAAKGQIPDHIYKPNIHSVKLYKYGDIYNFPLMMLKSKAQLEIHFD